MAGMEPLGGKLLVATPRLADPNFFRTVLLICEHSEYGAVGLILNRPTAELVADHLPRWAPLVAEPPVVFEGGPVQPETAIGLGGSEAGIAIPGWNPVTDRVGMFDLSTEEDHSSQLSQSGTGSELLGRGTPCGQIGRFDHA